MKYCDGLDCTFCQEEEPCIYRIANKLQQCLDEIEEIVIKRQKEHYCYCDECSPFKEILRKIKEVKE